MSYSSSRRRGISGFGAALVILLAIVFFGGSFALKSSNEATSTGCVVTKTESVSQSDGGAQKRVYTKNCGEFTVNDMWWIGYVNSGSVYGQIVEGGTYDFEHRGVRWNFPTMFPNITKATEVTPR